MITNAPVVAAVDKEKISFRGAFWIVCVGATVVFWTVAGIVIWRLM